MFHQFRVAHVKSGKKKNMTDTQDNAEQPQAPAEALTTEKTVPYDRFSKVNSELQALKKQLEDKLKADSDKETQSLAEQNRYKELYEKLLAEHEPLKQSHEQAQRYKASLEASNQARLERIPEDKRKYIPRYDDPVMIGEWLDLTFDELVTPQKPQPPNLNGGSGGGGSARESTSLSADAQSVIDVARAHGYPVNPERVAQYAKNPIKQSNTGD